MTVVIATFLFAVFLFLSGIHVYWALGGKWAADSVIPTKNNHAPATMPGAVPTLIVALGLLTMGLFILTEAGVFSLALPHFFSSYGLWIIGGIFIVRAIGDFRYVGLFKKYRETKFGRNDTKYYVPLCLIIGTLTLLLAILK